MMIFETIQPATDFGACPFEFTAETVAEWTALFPDDRAALPNMPPAMMSMVVMRAFMVLMRDRPPGNIHAGQKYWISALPVLGETLSTRLICLGKEFKNERRWVRFGSETVGRAGALFFRGEMTTIWAA